MQMQFAIVALALASALSGGAGELKMNLPSVSANIKIGKSIETTKVDEPIFRPVICNFSITQTPSSQPSFILAGKVVSNNTGTAQEGIPVFFGSTLRHPRLAALTNTDGEFRFRVWIADKQTEKLALKSNKNLDLTFSRESHLTLQTTAIRESALYLTGKFDQDGDMRSSFTHIHSLREFLESDAKQKP